MAVLPLAYVFRQESPESECSISSGHVRGNFVILLACVILILALVSVICQVLAAVNLKEKLRSVGVRPPEQLRNR